MTVYFVTRHAGAVDWAAQRGIDATLVEHLDPEMVREGDSVLGTLPVSLVAEINARGGRYLHLTLNLPAELRGRELNAEEMNACGAVLDEFEVRKV